MLVKDLHVYEDMAIEQRETFVGMYKQFIAEKGSKIEWGKIQPPPPGMIKLWDDLPEPTKEELPAYTSKLAVLKLNGGLGTSMGCNGPKSVIQVRSEDSFSRPDGKPN
jgi:UTP--glucose-1-phosphate uridylyltransferase